MRPRITTSCTLVLAALLLCVPLSAHHAAILFDTTTPIRVKGTVVRFIWADPHSAIIVEEKTADGRMVRWALESSAPIRMLEQRGFSRESFEPGDVIEACGFAPKSAMGGREAASNRETSPGPVWLEGADRIITARVLLTQKGTEVDWSRYGPLELCMRG